jgi:lipopolysaccharide transport system permease protein
MFHNLRQLVRYRALIQSLVTRELKARYRGSVLGFFWSFINPLLLLVVYSFVFTVVLPGTHPPEIEPYALFLFCGILPWTWFSSSLTEAANSLMAGGNLIKKVLFPAEILPIVSVLANMMHFFFGLPILVAFLLYFRPTITIVEVLWFPVVVAVQLVFTLGLSLLLAALTVHFRDIKDILSNHLAPGTISKAVLNANPFSHFAVSYQEILFYEGPFGHWKWLLGIFGASLVLFLVGYFLFDRLRDSFAEEV